MSRVVQGKAASRKCSDPPLPENRPPLPTTLQQRPYTNPYTGSAIMPAKRPRVYTPRFGLRLIMPRYAIPLGMARRKAKICPPGTVFDRQHEIFARSYRDQPQWVQGTRSSAISSDHLVPYQDDEERIWRYCSSNRRGPTAHPACLALPALPPIRWQSSITSSHNHYLAGKAPPERANWNTLRSNITGI